MKETRVEIFAQKCIISYVRKVLFKIVGKEHGRSTARSSNDNYVSGGRVPRKLSSRDTFSSPFSNCSKIHFFRKYQQKSKTLFESVIPIFSW